MVGNEAWTPRNAGPWHRLGVWLMLYGFILAAPSVAVAFLLALASLAGTFPLPGEFYLVAGVASVSLPAVATGWLLVRRGRRRQVRLQEIDEYYWF